MLEVAGRDDPSICGRLRDSYDQILQMKKNWKVERCNPGQIKALWLRCTEVVAMDAGFWNSNAARLSRIQFVPRSDLCLKQVANVACSVGRCRKLI